MVESVFVLVWKDEDRKEQFNRRYPVRALVGFVIRDACISMGLDLDKYVLMPFTCDFHEGYHPGAQPCTGSVIDYSHEMQIGLVSTFILKPVLLKLTDLSPDLSPKLGSDPIDQSKIRDILDLAAQALKTAQESTLPREPRKPLVPIGENLENNEKPDLNESSYSNESGEYELFKSTFIDPVLLLADAQNEELDDSEEYGDDYIKKFGLFAPYYSNGGPQDHKKTKSAANKGR